MTNTIPKLAKEFIQTNFAGQIGKGTLYGLDCLKAQMYLAYQKYGYSCWIVKADISKFFYNIDHKILKDIVEYFVEDRDVYWLCEKFIDSTDGLGLPLGNQISQVYALLYLSGLDHFITGELGVKYYGRYMDDFYLIVPSKEYAKFCLSAIYKFAYTYVTSDGKVIRKLKNENKRAAKKKFKKMIILVKKNKLSKDKFYESYNAWKNHISHGNCVKLRYEMDRYVEKLFSI